MRLHIFHALPILLLLIVCTEACQHDPLFDDDVPMGPPDTMIVNPPDTSTSMPVDTCDPAVVYFDAEVLPILRSNCAFSGCHGNGSAQNGVELSTYENVMATADVRPFDLDGSDLYEVITETDPDKRMPPPPRTPLSAEQISIISEWILQGAKDLSCTACDTTNVGFQAVVHPIIQNNCQGCHSGNTPQGGIRLVNYMDIQTIATNGKLLGVIEHQSGFTPMPFNQPKLDDCLISQIRVWVQEGAQNN